MIVGVASLVPFAAVQAQFDSSSLPTGIVANGSSELKIEPVRLRLTMQVQAKGKDAKSAIKSLTAHKDRVRKALTEMNADPESIQFARTQLNSGSTSDSEQMQYMRMMQMMQRQASGIEIEAAAAPVVYTATSSLRVEWPLPTKDSDALAMLPQELKDQIASRDLAGKENQPNLSEEELERLEEMDSSVQEEFGFAVSGESTEPTVVFVGRPSKQQRTEAVQQAFQAAKDSAELTATALQTEIIGLKTAWPYKDAANDPMAYLSYGSSSDSTGFGDDEDTVTAPTADGLKFGITVLAVYDFGQRRAAQQQDSGPVDE